MTRLCLLLCVMLSISTAFAQKLAPTIQENGTTLVPLRFIGEWMGANVQFEAKTKAITFTMGNRSIMMTVNSSTAVVNGQTTSLAAPPRVERGTTFVPLRFVSTNLGLQVDWLKKAKEIVLRQQTPARQLVLHSDMAESRTWEEQSLLEGIFEKDNVEDLQHICTARPWLQDPKPIDDMPLTVQAVIGNAPKSLEYLLGKGVDVNALNSEGNALLHIAIIEDVKMPVLEVLVKAGADVNAPEGEIGGRPLHIAATMNKKEVVEFLLEHHADVNATLTKTLDDTPFADLPKDKAGFGTPLMFAVLSGNTEIAQLLEKHGATPLDPELREQVTKLADLLR